MTHIHDLLDWLGYDPAGVLAMVLAMLAVGGVLAWGLAQ